MERILCKIAEVFSTVWGWVIWLACFVINLMAPHWAPILIVVLSATIDLTWGIAASWKQHKFTKSELARDTVSKLSVYGSAVLVFSGLDRIVGTSNGLTMDIICAVITCIEFWSSMGSMLICFPKMPFLRLLRFALIGEVANKLQVPEETVKKIFDEIKS